MPWPMGTPRGRFKFATLETRGELGRVNVRKDFWDFEQRTSTGKGLIAFLGSDFAPLFSSKSSL